MRHVTFQIFTVAAIWLFCAPVVVQAVGSFGITPPYVINYELEPDTVHEQRIFIVRRDPDKDLEASIRWEVPGADTWLTIDRGQTFTLPAGEQRVPMIVRVEVPTDVQAGQYTGVLEVEVHGTDEQTRSGMIAVGLELSAEVDLRVVRDGEVAPTGQVAGVFFSGLIPQWPWVAFALISLVVVLVGARRYSRRKPSAASV